MKLAATIHELEASAAALSAKFPELLVEAQHVAQTVSHGIHGRRRSGPGETYWQFRQFEQSDVPGAIDWRRSAGSDHLFVREREWEAAHSVWFWLHASSSMAFQSHLSHCKKAERAIVLVLAIADLLSRGGERIGLLGRRLWSGRMAVQRVAEAIARDLANQMPQASGPPNVEISRFSECVLFSDFLEPASELIPRIERIAANGVRGHMVQILDPAEESLPYEGHTKFVSSEGDQMVTAGRAESLRSSYQERMAQHRKQLIELADRLGWSFLVHHSDRSPEHVLLTLHSRLSGVEGDYRHRSAAAIHTADRKYVVHT